MLRIVRVLAVSVVALGVLSGGCRRQRQPPSKPVADCLTSMQRAVDSPTLAEATNTYYSGCAEMFSAEACKSAWKTAATAPYADQLGIVVNGCRKAYCPDMTAFSLAICRDDFDGTEKSMSRDWPPLFDAIVSREAQYSAADLQPFFLALYVKLSTLASAEKPPEKAPEPPKPAAADAGAHPAAPSSAAPAASAAKPAPSASAAKPAPSAKAAKPAPSAK
jgi:hypothetical protein